MFACSRLVYIWGGKRKLPAFATEHALGVRGHIPVTYIAWVKMVNKYRMLGGELNRKVVSCYVVRAYGVSVYNLGQSSLGVHSLAPFSFLAPEGFAFSFPPPPNLLYPASAGFICWPDAHLDV